MDLNICIVHYNSEDTIPCLESIAAQTQKAQVLLVDNCSTDDSMVAVRKYANSGELQIRIFDAPVNGGFAAGNNIALRWAHNHTPEAWNLLLNNDTVLPEDFIEKMTGAAEKIRKEGGAPFALYATEYNYFSRRKKRHNGKQYLSVPTGLCFNSPGIFRTPYLCGACILIPPQAPLLDEGFFLYYEDADYSKQLENDGYRLLTTDCTRYYHKVGGSTSRNENIVTIQMKSMWRYYLKHYPQWAGMVKWLRWGEYIVLGRSGVAHIVNQTYKQQIILKK